MPELFRPYQADWELLPNEVSEASLFTALRVDKVVSNFCSVGFVEQS